jgi:hypothetical protein
MVIVTTAEPTMSARCPAISHEMARESASTTNRATN